MRHTRRFLALIVALATLLAWQPGEAQAATPVYFPQTGHALGPHFTLAWRERGGLSFFGYPISEEFIEPDGEGRITQYFERAVLHYFPEHRGTPYTVQGRHLGRELTTGREAEAPFRPVAAAPGDRYRFAETGHTLGGAFGRAWEEGGGLIVFGYPLSEEFVEVNPADGKPYLTQYFERVRMEYHPELAGTPYVVSLGLLGAQRAAKLNLLGTQPFSPTPAPPAFAETIHQFPTSEPAMVLTFDAGSDRGYTAQILDTLAANGIKGSFGLTGAWALANPDLVERIGAEGHHVINHTFSHRSFTGRSDGLRGLTADERIAELEQTDAIIASLIGRSTRPWFRPPYGDFDDAALAQIAAAGYTYNAMWTIDTLGWNGLSAQAVLDRTLAGAAPGAIVLMHVGASSSDAAALQPMIDALRARGYYFATLEELAAR
jgi:peptidoglycan/xylan/chitin deacetylase (PgdA/CDA1 family)